MKQLCWISSDSPIKLWTLQLSVWFHINLRSFFMGPFSNFFFKGFNIRSMKYKQSNNIYCGIKSIKNVSLGNQKIVTMIFWQILWSRERYLILHHLASIFRFIHNVNKINFHHLLWYSHNFVSGNLAGFYIFNLLHQSFFLWHKSSLWGIHFWSW